MLARSEDETHGTGQESPAQLAPVSDPLGHARAGERPGGLEARRQDDRPVESSAADLEGEALARLRIRFGAFRLVDEDLVDFGEQPVELRDPRAREHRERAFRVGSAERADGRERQDDVADPVRRANERPHAPRPARAFSSSASTARDGPRERALARLRPARGDQARPFFGVAQERGGGGFPRLGRERGDEAPGRAVVRELRNAAHGVGQHGTSRGHRFDESERRALALGRQEQEMAGRESRSDVLDLPREDAAARRRRGRRRAPRRRTRSGPEPRKKQRRIEAAAHEAREDLDRDVLPLPAVEGADVHEPEGGRGRHRSVDEGLGGKAVRDHRDPRRRDSGRFERRGHGRGDGEEAVRGAILHARQRMSGRAEDDAPVDDERAARSRAAPHGGAVSARVSRVEDVRPEEPGGPGHATRGDRARPRSRAAPPRRRSRPASQDSASGAPRLPTNLTAWPRRESSARSRRRLPLSAAQRSAEVEGEQPHTAGG